MKLNQILKVIESINELQEASENIITTSGTIFFNATICPVPDRVNVDGPENDIVSIKFGDHEIAQDREIGSWKDPKEMLHSLFKELGFQLECHLQGLKALELAMKEKGIAIPKMEVLAPFKND